MKCPVEFGVVTEHMTQVGSADPVRCSAHLGIVIPTYNAEPFWPELQASLHRQGIDPQDVLIVDSSSTDQTYDLAVKSGYRVMSIRKEDFGHGATRQMACDCLPDVDVLVYLTQDASLPDATALANLCKALEDSAVGAAYGRQAPRPSAKAIERHARLFNYPDRSHTMTFASRETHGIKAAFCSNSFAAYRRSALMAVGGFPLDVILAEDSVVAARLLMAGWKVVYRADAVAVHSHALRLRQEFGRYFDTGVHHAREQWLLDTFGTASSEGGKFVRSEVAYLLRQSPLSVPVSLLRTCNKLLGYRLGKLQKYLPVAACRRFSAYPDFWSSRSAGSSRQGAEAYRNILIEPLRSSIAPAGTGRAVDPSSSP